ncbi:recombinase family protein [Leifsonia aquatica]|uniref:recombinase family protein n=1 Tax=Leifsonia aquatica TaxID=144185 RepID=UPI0038206C77
MSARRAEAAAEQPLRAVLYLRQSISKEESISLALQESAGREYCRSRGYAVVAVEEDPGISGRTWKRPGVQRVMQLIERGDADVIVLWKWSRLSRARLDWAIAVDKVESAGGRIESATEPLDTTTAAGRLARGMLAEFSAFESERIGDVWKETHDRRLARGLPARGGDRFGYVRVDGGYAPHPEQASIVVELYRRYTEEDHGLSRLTAWLNSSGVPGPRGNAWSLTSVKSVLNSGFAAGYNATNMRSQQPTYVPGAHPPLITEERWQAYLARRDRAPRPSGHVTAKSVLAGLIRCGDCGGPMVSKPRPVDHRTTAPGYACGLYSTHRDGRRFVSCYQRDAVAAVRDWVFALADDVDVFADLERALAPREVTPINDATTVERRLTKARGSLGALTVKWVDGKVTDEAYHAAAARLQSEITRLQAQEVPPPAPTLTAAAVRELAVGTREAWEQGTPHELRTLLQSLIAHVTVLPTEKGVRRRVAFAIKPLWER